MIEIAEQRIDRVIAQRSIDPISRCLLGLLVDACTARDSCNGRANDLCPVSELRLHCGLRDALG